MAKIESSQILKEGTELKVEEIDFTNQKVRSLVDETKRKQKEILRLKVVDQRKLKLVVQLF